MQNLLRTLTLATAVVVAGTASASAQTPSPYFDFLQGGWVDEEAGLIWGYATEAWFPISNIDWQSSAWLASDYGDPGQGLDAAGPAWEDEAIVAMFWESEGYLWRLPTKAEAEDAQQKGFFQNPDFLVPLEFSRPGSRRWTVTRRGRKRYWFDLNGNGGWANEPGFGMPMIVRPLTLPPPDDDDGPGNGNGKGKGKNK